MSNLFRPHNLSQREIEVIQLIADGLTDKEIASQLCITPRTVSVHINNIRSKLGASNRASAVYLFFFDSMAHRQKQHAPAPQGSFMSTKTGVLLRPADARGDSPAISTLRYETDLITSGCEFLSPLTKEGVEDDVARELADANHRFIVAQNADGTVVGFSQLSRYPWERPDKRALRLIVGPAHRGIGVGGELYDETVEYCAGQKILRLSAAVADNDAGALRFARKRGFEEVHHQVNFEFDLRTFDGNRFGDVTERVRAVGIRLSTMAEMGNTEDAQRKLFYLNSWCATLDLPGVKDEPAWSTWDRFRQTVCESWWYQSEGQIVAVDDRTGEWIGMCAVSAHAQRKGGDVMHTGVDRRYRHDPCIGQALKLAGIQYCIRHGASKMGDNHDARDATNLALNYSVGFTTLPGVIDVESKLS